jgi:hypothetical protein
MARVRKIQRKPEGKNFYLVDANFLVNRFIPLKCVTNEKEHQRVQRSHAWWKEIDKQLEAGTALVYVPDVCIAESFKVLAKKYYVDKYFKTSLAHKKARDALSGFLHTSPRTLRASKRRIKVHDISTSRDIIIAVDRFYEAFHKHEPHVGVIDLLILATAKYLIDFYNVPKQCLHIVTLDNALWRGSKRIADIPTAFNPNVETELAERIFE